ncbi:DUF2252 family protein [Methylocystis sp.]|uniref:DUF2252 family protein n=1 Tax=Methylocystis sp. TaxID=1911079 RepID=UPI0025F8C642|nr:DUF2252 family protein [Methylocystis sp.]
MQSKAKYPQPKQRSAILESTRNLKMARSAHRYVRGSTVKFYEWLDQIKAGAIPEGPSIWICGDCHVGNLGPVANYRGAIEIQIRDLDQTVIGNPAHDLLRLALSLASAARGSDLPGVTTALMLEAMMEGYEKSFAPDFDVESDLEAPDTVRLIIRQSSGATWKTLANERINGPKPQIPLGRRFWPISKQENDQLTQLAQSDEIRRLATMLGSRDDDAAVKLQDAAYWMKGCSSLGLLRYAALLSVGNRRSDKQYCLMDFKEAKTAAAPRAKGAKMPLDQAERMVEGARYLSPYLGKRARATSLLGKPVFVRELLPQDLKVEVEKLTDLEAVRIAAYLAAVVGKAHSRQLDASSRKAWLTDLERNRTSQLDAPTWLWKAVVELLGIHERAYLEHCRKYALSTRETRAKEEREVAARESQDHA